MKHTKEKIVQVKNVHLYSDFSKQTVVSVQDFLLRFTHLILKAFRFVFRVNLEATSKVQLHFNCVFRIKNSSIIVDICLNAVTNNKWRFFLEADSFVWHIDGWFADFFVFIVAQFHFRFDESWSNFLIK